MAITIDGIDSADNMLKILDKFGKQVPFATSLALNKTGEAVQKHMVGKLLPRAFWLRRPWWRPRTKFGVNLKPSNKRNLVTTVFSRAPWLKDHEEGGTKKRTQTTPGTSEKLVTMPVKAIRQTKSRQVKKSFSIEALFKKTTKPVFWIKKGDKMLLMQRTGKGDGDVRVLYTSQDQAKIKAKLKFEETGVKIAKKQYPFQFQRALKFAARTARIKIR